MDNVSGAGQVPFTSHTLMTTFSVSLFPWRSFLPLAVGAYALLASSLRFRRIEAAKRKFGYITRDSMARMTDNEAHDILKIIVDLEFPAMFEKGLQLALFRSTLHLVEIPLNLD